MNKVVQTLIVYTLLGGGGFLVYDGYNKGTDGTPAPVDGIELVAQEEKFPGEPSPALQAKLAPITEVMKGEPDDSLVIARMYRDFATLTTRTPSIDNIVQFTNAYKAAVQAMLVNTNIEGKYRGRIFPIVEEAYKEELSFMIGPDGLKTTAVDDRARAALVTWLNACSWKFHQCFLENIDAKLTK